VASNYTRYIEFKVKGQELTQAVDRIFKGVNKIEISVEKVNKKVKITGDVIKDVEKNVKKTDTAVQRLAKDFEKVNKAAQRTQTSIGKMLDKMRAFRPSGGSGGGILRTVAEFGALEVVVKKVIPALYRFAGAHSGIVAGTVAIGAAFKVGIPAIYSWGKAVRQAEQSVKDFMRIRGSSGMKKAIQSFFPAGSHLGGNRQEIKKAVNETKKLVVETEKVKKQYRQTATGINKLREQLSKTKKIQDQLLSSSKGYENVSKKVLNIQREITKEEKKRAVINRRIDWKGDLMKLLSGKAPGVLKLGAGLAGGATGLLALDGAVRKLSDTFGKQIGLIKAVNEGGSAFWKTLKRVESAVKPAVQGLLRYEQALVALIREHPLLTQAIGGTALGLASIARFTPAIFNLGGAFRQLTADIAGAFQRTKDFGLSGLFSQGSILGQGNILDSHDLDLAGEAASKQFRAQSAKGPAVESIGGLRAKNAELARTRKNYENIDQFNKNWLTSARQLGRAQAGYNRTLAESKFLQKAVTLDIFAAQNAVKGMKSAVKGLVDIAKGGLGGLGGLLGGKGGRLGQAAGVITISAAVQKLIQHVPMLSKAWKDNIQVYALWVQRVTEGFAAVKIAYTAFDATLSAASWTIGAIAGFKKWESEAALTIRRVNRQVNDFYLSLSAMWMMMQGKGGTAGGVGQLFNEMRLGGERRIEEHRFADQGPTQQQKLQEQLDFQTQKLNQRNSSEKDYLTILKEQLRLKDRLAKTDDRRLAKEVEAGRAPSMVFKDEYQEHLRSVKKVMDAEKAKEQGLRKARKLRAQENKAQFKDELKDIRDREKARLDSIRKIRQAEMRAAKDLAATRKRRGDARRDAMGRFGENVMLGAGFPLLFGGGVGSVAGGLTGAVGQSALGSKGFGMQIFFSAIGQQVDAFAAKATELGKALRNPTEALSKLAEMGIQVDKNLQANVKSLIAAGRAAEAQALVNKEVAKVIGMDGVKALKDLGVANEELMTKANKLRIKIMSEVAPAFMTLIDLAGKFVDQIGGQMVRSKAQEMAIKGGRPELWKAAEQKATEAAIKINPNKGLIDSLFNKFGVTATDVTKGPTADKYYEVLTQESRNILEEMMSGFLGKEKLENLSVKPIGEGREKNPMALTDLEQKDLQILEKRIDLLKVRDGLSDKELYKKQESILISERDRVLQEAINNGKATALIMKEYDLKFLELEQGYLEKVKEKYAEIGGVIKDGMVNAIEGAIQGTKTLGEVASSVFRQISRAFINLAITGAFGKGGLGIPGFAEGGSVGGGSPIIVGEKGPEIFTPGKSGYITPNHALGGTNNVTINVDAGGSSMQGDAEQAGQLGRMLAVVVQDELAKQKRPGGILY